MRKGVAVAVLASSSLSGCWLQPGVDAGHTRWNATETTLTAANVADVVQQWSYTPQSGAHLAPVSVDGRVVLVTRRQIRITDPEVSPLVTSIDATTGAPVWTTELPLYPNFGQGALDPVYLDGTIAVPRYGAVQNGGGIDRVEATTGEVVSSAPGIHLRGLSEAGGELAVRRVPELGQTEVIDWRYTASLPYDPGATPVPGQYAFVGDRLMWSQGTIAYSFGPTCAVSPCPPTWTTDLGGLRLSDLAAAGDDQVAYTAVDGTLSVLDATTGAVRWRAELSSEPSAPVVADGTIFVTVGPTLYTFAAAGCGAALCDPLWTGTFPNGTRQVIAAGDVVYIWHPGSTIGVTTFPVHGCGSPTCAPLATVAEGHDVRNLIVDAGHLIALTGNNQLVAFGLP